MRKRVVERLVQALSRTVAWAVAPTIAIRPTPKRKSVSRRRDAKSAAIIP